MYRSGQLEDAIKLWEQSISLGSLDETLTRNIAVCYEKTGDKAKAIQQWRRLAFRWRLQVKQRSSEPGFKDLLIRLERHLIGLMMKSEEPEREIIAEIDSALKIDPSNREIREIYIRLLLDKEQGQQALKHLDFVERQYGESSDLLILKALALEMTGKRGVARKAFERALELDPSNHLGRKTYLMVLDDAASRAWNQGLDSEVISISQKQLDLDPDHLPAISGLARIYFELEEDEQADEILTQMIQRDPDNNKKRVFAGAIYLENGYDKEADAQFGKAAELDPGPMCLFMTARCIWILISRVRQ